MVMFSAAAASTAFVKWTWRSGYPEQQEFDKVRLCLGKSKRNHKDNMLMYDAYLEVIGVKEK